MKWLLLFIIFLFCTLVGYTFSLKYKKRMSFYSSLIFLAQKLDVEINFSRERLIKLIESCDEKNRVNLLNIDKKFIDYLNKGGELTPEMLFSNKNLIKKEEQEVIAMFFRSLGRSDVENQIKEIKNYVSRFEKYLSDSTQEYKKNGPIGIKLGIITGLILVVILL